MVLAHIEVGGELDVRKLGRREDAVKVDGHDIAAQVKADIMKAVVPVDEAGDNVLAGMLHREIVPPDAVNHAFDERADSQRRSGRVPDLALLFVDIRDGHAAQQAMVGPLSAALREKCGAVEQDGIGRIHFLTIQNTGIEPAQRGVGFVKFLCRGHEENLQKKVGTCMASLIYTV